MWMLASFEDSGRTSFGMCIRDGSGTFILARMDWVPSYLPVREGEALGLLKADQWVKELGLHDVLFELDCQVVVNSLKNHIVYITDFGVIISACQELLCSLSNLSVSFFGRQVNSVAHNLAKATLFIVTPQFLLSYSTLYCFVDY